MKSRSITAVAIAALAAVASATPAHAASTVRYADDDRYETAAKVSAVTFGDGADTVYLATGEAFPDALAGGAAAAEQGGPVLLVTRDTLPESTATEIQRLTPDNVVLLGGTGVISQDVEDEVDALVEAAEVTRIAGENRYTTAVEVSQKVFEPGVADVLVVGGEGFADALAAGAVAAASHAPVLLVQQDAVPSTVAAELDRLSPSRITIVGGTGSVSDNVKFELVQHTDGDVVRISGNDRYATSAAASAAAFDPPKTKVFLANGTTFPDALAGTPAAAVAAAPLLLVHRNCIPQIVQDEIDRLAPDEVVLLGGTGTLDDAVERGQVCEEL
jgi:putative cell wall-binding protein